MHSLTFDSPPLCQRSLWMLPFFDASVIDGVICEVDTKIDELVIPSFCTVEFGVFGIKLVIVLEIVDGIQGIFCFSDVQKNW